MEAFCTIITYDYLFYAQALQASFKHFHADIPLHVFIADEGLSLSTIKVDLPNTHFYTTDTFEKDTMAQALHKKYVEGEEDYDKFRWSMKSVFMRFLLEEKACEKVIFLDPDLYFFNDGSFLFQALDDAHIILTPHWRSSDPKTDLINFNLLSYCGLFNAGFIGATKDGIPALNQWAEWCLFKCLKDRLLSHFDDQGYLDLLPIYFEKVKIIRHKGCNVANWNQIECKRVRVKDKILINGEEPIIFMHFTKSTIQGIQHGEDGLLETHLEEYLNTLKHFNPAFDPDQKYALPAKDRLVGMKRSLYRFVKRFKSN